jgi:1-acyl-sn-glycerol-3-phosphate acyltransferase
MWALVKVYLGFLAIGLEIVGHLPYAPWLILARLLGRRAAADAWLDRMVQGWGRRCLKYLECRVEVQGLEHLPPRGPVILMSNHQSLLDIPVCLGFLGRTMGFVAKRELFRIPALSFWMRQIHCASMDRADVRSSGALLEALSRRVREGGYCLLIFPEGTRTRHPDGELGPFRRGALRLAEAEGIPIVPLSLDGTRFLVQLKALSRIPPRRRIVRVRLAPLVPVPMGMSAPESKRLMESLRQTIHSNWQALRIDWTQPLPVETRRP